MVERLVHGYTNLTRRIEGAIEKRYEGFGRFERARTERDCIEGMTGLLPLPQVIRFDADEALITLREVPGDHGQDLIAAGQARLVLQVTGRLLRQLQTVSPSAVPTLEGQGKQIVHGDFGPQNLLVDPTTGEAAALLDWEFAHLGDPLEDFAWAEWIVRMHHPEAVEELPALHEAYAGDVTWDARHAAMVRKCHELRIYCERQGWSDGVTRWRERATETERWGE